MVDPKRITAVIVTKCGPVPPEVLAPLSIFAEVLIWDNSIEPDQIVYGRFVMAERAKTDFVYVQDDDCTVDAAALVAEYQPGELLCNMGDEYRAAYAGTGMALVGFGAIFPRSFHFGPYFEKYRSSDHAFDDVFLRECDRVFTFLYQHYTRLVDVPKQDLTKAFLSDRMWKEKRHGDDLKEIKRRLATLDLPKTTLKDGLEQNYWSMAADFNYHAAKLTTVLWAFGFYRQAASALEIGTGPLGGFLPFIKAARRVGVDPCYGLYQESGVLRLYPGVTYITEHFENWATWETFDLIFSSDSLDHGSMGFHLLPRIVERLNPGGRFYLHVHLRTPDQLNQSHDHCLTVEQLDCALKGLNLKELRRDFYPSDIDGVFPALALVGVWEKPL